MKSDKKMTENILERVSVIEAQKTHKRKTLYKISASLGAFALILAAAFIFLNNTPDIPHKNNDNTIQTPDDTTAPSIQKGFSFVVANAAETDEDYKIFNFSNESNMILPLGGILQVTDIRGLSPHSVSIMSHNLIERLEEKYGENKTFSVFGSETQPTAIHFGTLGQMAVKTDDASALESIVISCTDNGKITVHDIYAAAMGDSEGFLKSHKEGQEITVSGEEYLKHYDSREEGMLFDWFVSQETEDMLRSNPDAPLSEINDIITVTVNYTDSTSEQFTLTLEFDDNGILTSTYNYNS